MVPVEVPALSLINYEHLEAFRSADHPAFGISSLLKLPFPSEITLPFESNLPDELVSTVLSHACHLVDCLSVVLHISLPVS